MKNPTEGRMNPKLLFALGALVIAALLFVFVVNPMFLNPHDEPMVVMPAPAARSVTPPADGIDEQDDEDVPDSLEVFNARDPFRQLVNPAPGTP